MQLIIYYIAFMVVGDLADYLICLGIERALPNAKELSLIVCLTLYFLFLWLAWVLAVRLTEPKHVRRTA